MRRQQDTALHKHQASCDPEHPPHAPGHRASGPAYHGSATGGRVLADLTASRSNRPDITNDFMLPASMPASGKPVAAYSQPPRWPVHLLRRAQVSQR
jgi:hypothetical protein